MDAREVGYVLVIATAILVFLYAPPWSNQRAIRALEQRVAVLEGK